MLLGMHLRTLKINKTHKKNILIIFPLVHFNQKNVHSTFLINTIQAHRILHLTN